MRLTPFLRALVLSTMALGLVACDEGEGESGAYGPRDTDQELVDVTLSDDEIDDWEVFRFSSLTPPYDTEDECLAHLEDEFEDTSEMTVCRCNECFEIMQECDAVPGCPEIRTCAQESGCDDEFSCYLSPFATCTEVIDTWGNAGLATATSVELMDCSMASDCQ